MTLSKRAIKQKTTKRKNNKLRFNTQLFRKTFASFCLVLTFVPLSVVPTVSINEESGNKTDKNSHLNISLKLDTKSSTALAADSKNLEIVPGESAVDKAAREQAEADAAAKAKAKAEAAAKAKIIRTAKVSNNNVNIEDVYINAQNAYGVDARILKAVHIVETGASGSTSRTSYAGAVGPMQFLPSTWRSHSVDGDGDGVADITNVTDAIFTAAAYLKACGYPNVQKALWGYNRSTSYYNKVMNIAYSLGY